MRMTILLAGLLIVTACSRKPDVYIVTTGSAVEATQADDSGS